MFMGMSDVLTDRAMVNIIVEVEDISPQNNFQPSSVIAISACTQLSANSSVPQRKSGHSKVGTIPGTAVFVTS